MSDAGKVNAGQAGQPPVFDSYARLSWNPTTHELEKIETQHEDNRATIERHRGVLGLELQDGLSAWKKNVRCKDFETMLLIPGTRRRSRPRGRRCRNGWQR